ncbi:MAG: hypothetical protein CVV02_17945 [Firmicutes bacterium HGW-Firmicutes-7]|nr:MAG: hypothetical protein CVV02_17945 [Firmicutes bacterium HGW-Firmicutes-7]
MQGLYLLLVEILVAIDFFASLRNRYIAKEGYSRFLLPIVIIINLGNTSKIDMIDIMLYVLFVILVVASWAFIGVKYYIKPVDVEEAFMKLEDLADRQNTELKIELLKYHVAYFDFGAKPKVIISNRDNRKLLVSFYRVANYKQFKKTDQFIQNKLRTLELSKCSDLISNSIILFFWTSITVYYLIRLY